jgi:phage gpG-like protein
VLNISLEYKGLLKSLTGIKQRGALGMYKALERTLIFLEARIKESVRNTLHNSRQVWGIETGGKGTGRLRSDWSHKIDMVGSRGDMSMEGRVGTAVIYAPVHEFGGKRGSPTQPGQPITPVNAKALTIPFPGTAGQYPPARTLFGRTFISRKSGIIFLIEQKMGKKATGERKVIPIYVLRRQAVIPARPFVKPTLDTHNSTLNKCWGMAGKPL